MNDKYLDKPIEPRWLGVDISGNGVCACPICNQIIIGKPETCPSCKQKFTYEKEEIE